MHKKTENDADTAQLAALGHKSELNRNFSPLSMLGLAFAILNSWTALAASLSLALPSGGPTSVLWGLISMPNSSQCLRSMLMFDTHSCGSLQSMSGSLARRVSFRVPYSWWSISLGGSGKLEEMGSDTELDNWVD